MATFIEDLSALSDSALLNYSVDLAKHENDVGLQIIACLREAEKRMLYLTLNFTSLWDYATQFLGLSNGNAQQKIDAMRLGRDNPIAREKIESGELSILNAAKVNSFLRQEKKAGLIYTPEQKAEVIESVLGLSQSKCERSLLERAPESIPAEKVRPLTETKTELKIVVDEKTMAVLDRLKELLSNKFPTGVTYAQLLDYLAREKVETLERKAMGVTLSELNHQEPAVSKTIATPNIGVNLTEEVNNLLRPKIGSVASTPRQYVSVEDSRWLMKRAKGQCERISENGSRCTSRWDLQRDHVVPLAQGGTHERSNFRLLCRPCNLYEAKNKLGIKVMSKYVGSLR